MLEGNLTRAPETRQMPSGTNCCIFSVASNRFYRASDALQKEVSFFDVECWSSLADRCAQELDKGRGVRVVGRLKQDRWVDQEGQNRSKIKIVAEHVEFKPVFNKDQFEAETDHDEAMAQEADAMEESPV